MTRYLKVLCALLALWTGAAWGQDYPSKPIMLVVPFAPGGSSDFLSRMIGQKLTEAWKQPAKLSGEINRILKTPDVIERLAAEGSVPAGNTPVEFARFIDSEQRRWGAVVKSAAIKPE